MRAAIAALAVAAAGCVPHTEAALDYCTIADPRATLLLVDRTTSYNDLDRQILAQGLERIYEGLQPGERMVVQTITHEYAATERVFDQCVPGCPEGESGPFSTCSQFTVEEDLAAFRAALSDSARGVVRSSSGTPILPTSCTRPARSARSSRGPTPCRT